MRGIRAAGFENPRPIQLETIPAGLKGRDVLGLAQTGTGKTAAFALPLLHQILMDPGVGPRALVLAPTRELATQIAAEIHTLSKYTRIRTVTIYGGVSSYNQTKALRNRPEIVVGCPGRVLDLIQQGKLKLDKVDTLVLDEADHMFDMGFLPDIRKILGRLPAKRQNLLFSATMPKDIRRLADDLLEDPHVVELAGRAPASTIDHAVYMVAEARKRALLNRLLESDECDSAIVFMRTKHKARRMAEQLDRAGHRAVSLQGNMSQVQRDRAMSGFRARKFDVLVATDIASRGIDVSDVSHVINYDVPTTPLAYTHRIGRTGRSEQSGIARTFVTRGDRGWLYATEKMIGSKISRERIDGFDLEYDEGPDRNRGQRSASGGGYRQRGSGGPRPNGNGRGHGGGRQTGGARHSSDARNNSNGTTVAPIRTSENGNATERSESGGSRRSVQNPDGNGSRTSRTRGRNAHGYSDGRPGGPQGGNRRSSRKQRRRQAN